VPANLKLVLLLVSVSHSLVKGGVVLGKGREGVDRGGAMTPYCYNTFHAQVAGLRSIWRLTRRLATEVCVCQPTRHWSTLKLVVPQSSLLSPLSPPSYSLLMCVCVSVCVYACAKVHAKCHHGASGDRRERERVERKATGLWHHRLAALVNVCPA